MGSDLAFGAKACGKLVDHLHYLMPSVGKQSTLAILAMDCDVWHRLEFRDAHIKLVAYNFGA